MNYLSLILLLGFTAACHSDVPPRDEDRQERPQQRTENPCLTSQSGFTQALREGGSAELEKCLWFYPQTGDTNPLYPARIYINFSGAQEQDKYNFAAWADRHQQELSNLYGWPSASGFGETYSLVKKIDESTLEAILDPYLMPTRPVEFILRPPAPKVFFKLQDLQKFLEKPYVKTAVRPESFSDARAQALTAFYRDTNIQQGLRVAEALGAGGCRESCLEAGPKVPAGAFLAQYRQYSVRNRIFRQEIVLYDQNNSHVAYASMAQAQLLTVILIDRGSQGEMAAVRAFTPEGQPAGERINKEDEAAKLRERQALLSHPPQHSMLVGVCEEGINPKLIADVGSLVFGPHTNESYYGWQKANDSPAEFWLGRNVLNRLDLPFSTESYAHHARKTIATLTNAGGEANLGIVPLGINQCLQSRHAARWFQAAKSEPRLRVLNISASEASDEAGCREMMRNHPIHDPHFLWVVAAGNQASPSPVACPQYLRGQKNVIIVGASGWRGMHEKSNYGEDFVDIATAGESAVDQDWGTSFAAPRVSRLAAKIFQKLPSVSAAEVRALILATAKIPSYNALPVRSLGELDERVALRAAEQVRLGKPMADAVKQTACSRWQEQQCDRRLQFFKNLNVGDF
jgi:hypothetical protein